MPWDFIIGVAFAAVAILGSIALHEAGHLIAARHFGVAAPEFGVGFGPRLFSYTPKNGKTTYGLHLLPLGGFVKLGGMLPPPSPDSNPKGFAARGYALQEEREEGWVGKKTWQVRTWQKVTIMAAGPAVNLALGVIGLVVTLCLIGTPGIVPELGKVVDGSPAAAAGLEPGDRITAINGTSTDDWDATVAAIDQGRGAALEVDYLRDGQTLSGMVESAAGEKIGISPSVGHELLPVTKLPAEVVSMVTASLQALVAYPANLVELAGTTFSEAPRSDESPMSMIGAGDVSGQIASQDVLPTRTKAFFLGYLFVSINFLLGFLNLIPLTPLDGGHIATSIVSSIRRRIAALRQQADPGPISPAVLTPVTLAMSGVFVMAGLVTFSADIIEPIRLFQ